MTDDWHLPIDWVDDYLADRVDHPTADSVEAHLLGCGTCRATLATRTIAIPSEWTAIERRIDAELNRPIEKFSARLGLADRDARVLAPTKGLRFTWPLAAALGLLFAALIARRGGGDGAQLSRVFFLTIAPLAPLAAVVTAVGATSEPIAEIAGATPASRLRIGALRVTAVLLGSLAIGLIASAIVPGSMIRAIAWLCPALALSALGALVAGRMSEPSAIAALGTGWVTAVVLASSMSDDRLAAFRAGPQLLYVAIGIAALAAIALRPSALELRRFP